MLKNGVIVVRFDTAIGKQEVIEGGIYHFDNKPLIVKASTPELEFTRDELLTVPVWIKLPGLDFKYWSLKGLSKIESLIGKPVIVDQNTEKRIGVNFARLLVEVEMDAKLPDVVMFRNEKGKLIEQRVNYDWKPTFCTHCLKYGHEEVVCMLKKKAPKNYQNTNEQTTDIQVEKQGQMQSEKIHEAQKTNPNAIRITTGKGALGKTQQYIAKEQG
ncbi:uncharacterized protein [Nicotiana sylvestris]|uniref:uncharacterized protein n=1 Tax=Nicotiana sylvestris TaxID=4096 RepID=UPI00388C6F35